MTRALLRSFLTTYSTWACMPFSMSSSFASLPASVILVCCASLKTTGFSPWAFMVGFTLNKRGWLSGPLKQVLPWSHVHALGPDAVTVAARDRLVPPDAEELAGGDAEDVVGSRVITDDGREQLRALGFNV